jgi:hypothetical protein
MEPGGQGVPDPHRTGLARQDEEGGLESVLRRVLIPQDGPAGAQDRRSVPLDQGREGALPRLTAPAADILQQLPVRQPAGRPRPEERLDVPEGAAESAPRHHPDPSSTESSPISMSRRVRIGPTFPKNPRGAAGDVRPLRDL